MSDFINQFPYSDFHEMNMDWILKKVKEFNVKMDEFTAVNNIKFEGVWDITKQYSVWSVVSFNDNAYIAVKNVPDGIDINNQDYWLYMSSLKIDQQLNTTSYNAIANKPVAEKFNAIDIDIDDLKDITSDDSTRLINLESNLEEEVEARTSADTALSDRINTNAGNISDEVTARTAADTVINGRIDEFTHLTDGSTTGDAELADIRVGGNGVTYDTAGDAVRGQYNALKTELDTYAMEYRGATSAAITTLKHGIYSVAKANAAAIGLPSGMVANYGLLFVLTTGVSCSSYLMESASPQKIWRGVGSTWYDITDTTLSKSGFFADSKTVGDNLFKLRSSTSDFDTALPGIHSFAKASVSTQAPSEMSTSYGYLLKLNTGNLSYGFVIEATAVNPAIFMKTTENGDWIRIVNYGILEGKKITFIGDSITEENETATYNYVKLLATYDKITAQNLGRSGVGYCRYHENNANFISKIASIDDDTDLIIVAGSFNDLGSSEPLGTPTDTGSDTICGYINAFYDALFEAFPGKLVIACTMNYWVAYPNNYSRFTNYVDALETICRHRAIPFIDIGKYCNIRAWDEDNAEAFCPDGTHPNNAGHKRIYTIIKDFMSGILPPANIG